MEHRATQSSADDLRFIVCGLGTRELRDHLASRGDADSFAVLCTIKPGGKILPKFSDVDIGHGLGSIYEKSVKVNCILQTAMFNARGPTRLSSPARCSTTAASQLHSVVHQSRIDVFQISREAGDVEKRAGLAVGD